MKNLSLILTLVFGVTMFQFSYADIGELNEEMIEADAIAADSEAAIHESEEIKKQLAEDRKEAERMKNKLSRERESAEIRRRKADKEIATNEKKIADIKAKMLKQQKEIEALQAQQEKLVAKNEKTKAELEVVNDQLAEVSKEKRKEEKDLRKIKREHRDMKAEAKSTATKVSAMRANVRKARVEIGKVYRKMKKDSGEYKKMIRIYRRTLSKASKMLDQLETAIEIDQAYDQKLADMGKKLPKDYKTVSGLNRARYATVTASACNLRAYPSTKAEVLGSVKGGKKVEMKYHSRAWYTVVYGGEKAFLGKSCFN